MLLFANLPTGKVLELEAGGSTYLYLNVLEPQFVLESFSSFE